MDVQRNKSAMLKHNAIEREGQEMSYKIDKDHGGLLGHAVKFRFYLVQWETNKRSKRGKCLGLEL
jgi:hypothetical protein